MKVLVTGGLGFIGSAVVRYLVNETDHEVVNVDKVTYAATQESAAAVADDGRYRFVAGDISDSATVASLFDDHSPDAVLHLAAETHVDRSIDSAEEFVSANLVGTFRLLEAARRSNISRFVYVGTDEVYGSLKAGQVAVPGVTRYDPRSPYAATKAGADHLVNAWGTTYGLPVIVTHSANNYGPFQYPEKLIPLMIIRALAGESLPVYGDGKQVRDWLHVDDHAAALVAALEQGQVGETYGVGANTPLSNLDVVEAICDEVDDLSERLGSGSSRRSLIGFVTDRPGHDRHYGIDPSKFLAATDWRPTVAFDDGLADTIRWYFDNEQWWRPLVERGATKRRGSTTSE